MFPSTRRARQSDAFDDWGGAPAAGPWPKWFGGILVPLPLIVYAIVCLVTHRGFLPGRHTPLDLRDANAVALGISSMAAGMFLHLHYFWGNVCPSSHLPGIGKTLALIAFIGSLGYVIVRITVGF